MFEGLKITNNFSFDSDTKQSSSQHEFAAFWAFWIRQTNVEEYFSPTFIWGVAQDFYGNWNAYQRRV